MANTNHNARYYIDLTDKEKWTLYKVSTDDEDQEESETVITRWYSDEEKEINEDQDRDNKTIDAQWKKIDDEIEKELGFLPNYEVN